MIFSLVCSVVVFFFLCSIIILCFFFAVGLPLDTVKTVIQATERNRGAPPVPGVMATMTRLVREGGIRRLYVGWPAALGRGIPGAAVLLATHSRVSRALSEAGQGGGKEEWTNAPPRRETNAAGVVLRKSTLTAPEVIGRAR